MAHLPRVGQRGQLAFDDVGTYQVRCLSHPKMKMTVDAR